jgi:hypothetical protein
MMVRTEVGRILGERGINPMGFDLDVTRRRRTNFVVMKASLDRQIARAIGRRTGERSEFTRAELDTVGERFAELSEAARREVFDA